MPELEGIMEPVQNPMGPVKEGKFYHLSVLAVQDFDRLLMDEGLGGEDKAEWVEMW